MILPDNANRHEVEISLMYQGRNTSPIKNTCPPLKHHIAFPDVKHDEWKCVNQSEDKHRPGNPAAKVRGELAIVSFGMNLEHFLPRYVLKDLEFS